MYFVTSLWSGWVIDHATRTDDSLWRPFALMQPCHFWQKANVLLAHRQACSSGKVCRAKLLLLLLWRCWCDAGLCICNLQGNIYWNISNILNQIELEKSFTWILVRFACSTRSLEWSEWCDLQVGTEFNRSTAKGKDVLLVGVNTRCWETQLIHKMWGAFGSQCWTYPQLRTRRRHCKWLEAFPRLLL